MLRRGFAESRPSRTGAVPVRFGHHHDDEQRQREQDRPEQRAGDVAPRVGRLLAERGDALEAEEGLTQIKAVISSGVRKG